jgi:uncharacterized protein (TIGR04141 family)
VSPARVRHLTVLLLREHFQSPSDALKNPAGLTRYELRPDLSFAGIFYVRSPREKRPSWMDFVQPGILDELEALENVSTAAVLLLEASSRSFAFTFGHGRSLLKPDSYEIDFGLKVALNVVDADRLRSVDVRTFEELTLHTRRQTSRGSSLDTFGLDVSRDLLRAVTGEPRAPAFGTRVTGSDALALNARLEFSELGRKCDDMLEAYKSDNYKQRFGWIDHLKAVRDPFVIDALNEQLVEALRANSVEKLHLAPAEPLDWERVEGFRYSTEESDEAPHSDLDIRDYLGTIEELSGLSVQDLKRARIELLYTELEQPVDRWSIYECIVFEAERGEALYVLTGGRWFEVATSFVDSVDQYVRGLPRSDLPIPSAQVGERERDYNERAAQGNPQLMLMDGKLVRCGGGQGPIEVCDLFSSGRQFVHVKRKLRSATLSHLFAQGAVSAEAFLRDSEFREDTRQIVASSRPDLAHLIPEGRPNAPEFEIVYAIITAASNDWPLPLPFFSRLHLMQASQRLQLLGYRVSTLPVDEVA